MLSNDVTKPTFHPAIFCLNALALENIVDMSVTAAVLQLPMF